MGNRDAHYGPRGGRVTSGVVTGVVTGVVIGTPTGTESMPPVQLQISPLARTQSHFFSLKEVSMPVVIIWFQLQDPLLIADPNTPTQESPSLGVESSAGQLIAVTADVGTGTNVTGWPCPAGISDTGDGAGGSTPSQFHVPGAEHTQLMLSFAVTTPPAPVTTWTKLHVTFVTVRARNGEQLSPVLGVGMSQKLSDPGPGPSAGARVSTNSWHNQIGFSTKLSQKQGTVMVAFGKPLGPRVVFSPPQPPKLEPSGRTPAHDVPLVGVLVRARQNSGMLKGLGVPGVTGTAGVITGVVTGTLHTGFSAGHGILSSKQHCGFPLV